MDRKISIEEDVRLYGTEEECIRELYRLKWPNGFTCPVCSHPEASVTRTRRLPLYECKRCRHQASLTAGTVMEKSKTPLRKWFLAMRLLARGATAQQLSDELRVTYKTAWLIGHKIRHAILLAESELSLTGVVRIQESRYGPTSFVSLFDRGVKRQPLLAAASVTEKGEPIRVKLHQVPPQHLRGEHVLKEGFQRLIKQNVSPQAQVTVAAGIYNGASHPLARFCRQAARFMNLTYFGLRPKHLQAYLDEYAYRHHLASGDAFNLPDLLQRCVTRPVITYPQLIRRVVC